MIKFNLCSKSVLVVRIGGYPLKTYVVIIPLFFVLTKDVKGNTFLEGSVRYRGQGLTSPSSPDIRKWSYDFEHVSLDNTLILHSYIFYRRPHSDRCAVCEPSTAHFCNYFFVKLTFHHVGSRHKVST